MAEFQKTERTSITRLPARGVYDKDSVYAILDEALFCTVAFIRDGVPFQIPTGFCRMGDNLYIHGSVGSTYMRDLATGGSQVCVGATMIDGVVLARSAFHQSVNYRSAVVFGVAKKVTDEGEILRMFEVFTNKMQPSRWNDIRKPAPGELKATLVLSVHIDEASAKVRTGPPKDDAEDYSMDTWAGVLPLQIQRQSPIADPLLKSGVGTPDYLK